MQSTVYHWLEIFGPIDIHSALGLGMGRKINLTNDSDMSNHLLAQFILCLMVARLLFMHTSGRTVKQVELVLLDRPERCCDRNRRFYGFACKTRNQSAVFLLMPNVVP